jgi:hypothetical protein
VGRTPRGPFPLLGEGSSCLYGGHLFLTKYGRKKIYILVGTRHVKWVHCHHGMARPRVADRGDGLQKWRVAANILNKQSWRADSGWSSSLGVGRGANNPSP